jgi:CheY-like chemotaxis protein
MKRAKPALLMVDDDLDVCCNIQSDQGYRVDTATRGPRRLQLVERLTFHP